MFSPSENKLLKILGRKKMTMIDISKEFYKDVDPPVMPNNSISSIVSRINNKARHHKLEWSLKGEGLGRHGRTIWKATV